MLAGGTRPWQRLWNGVYRFLPCRSRSICVTAHLTAEDKDALIKQIRHSRGWSKSKSPHGKVEVVSPQLCGMFWKQYDTLVWILIGSLADDVLNYIGPSLKRHRRCDIIDINPGVCLWSAKLHKYLRPRTHLLLEPSKTYYDHFVKPLTERRRSKYRHSSLDTEDWHTYQRIFDEKLICPPTQKGLDQSRPNDLLLLVANFARFPRRALFGFDSFAHMAVHQFFYQAIRAHSHVHAYGLIRMLLWMTDEDKDKIVPQDVYQRGKFALDMEMSGSVEVVVNSGKLSSEVGFYDQEMRSMQRVAETMDGNGMKPPPGRHSLNYLDATSALSQEVRPATDSQNIDPQKDNVMLRWEGSSELARLEKAYAAGELNVTKTRSAQAGDLQSRRRSRTSHDPRWQRLLQLRHHYKMLKSSYEKLTPLASLDEEIFQMELSLTNKTLSDDDSVRMTKEMQSKANEFKARRAELNVTEQRRLAVLIDNRFARDRDVPLLQWDRRSFEPLRADKDEFFAPNHLSLLDFQPKPPLVFDTIDQSEDGQLASWFVSALFLRNASSVTAALDSCAPAAAEALIPQAPSVTDPRKGGRLDPSELRVRVLTVEMVDELVKAWNDWPFRPSLSELRATGALGSKNRRLGTMA